MTGQAGSNFRSGDGAAQAAAAPAGPAARPAGLRILLVEDHADTVLVLTKVLTRAGHLVRTSNTVAGGLKLASSEPFDLLVSDLGLPDGTGMDLMKALRARKALPGIAISGFGRDEDLRDSREAGFVEHLVKPLDFRLLESAIRRVAGSGPAAAGT